MLSSRCGKIHVHQPSRISRLWALPLIFELTKHVMALRRIKSVELFTSHQRSHEAENYQSYPSHPNSSYHACHCQEIVFLSRTRL